MMELLNCPNRCIVRRTEDLAIVPVKDFTLAPKTPPVRAGHLQVTERTEPFAVQCNRCGLRGPVADGETAAGQAWNKLPRDKGYPAEREWHISGDDAA